MKQQLIDYAKYNLWANTTLGDLFRQQPDEKLEQTIISSFSSIRATFLHLWGVELLWMSRLRGVSPTSMPFGDFSGTNAELFDHLAQSSRELVQMVETASIDFLTMPIEFTFLSGTGIQLQLPKDIFQHVFNHQTMHRGQLITMGRQVGIEKFPQTDYIIWVRDQAQKG